MDNEGTPRTCRRPVTISVTGLRGCGLYRAVGESPTGYAASSSDEEPFTDGSSRGTTLPTALRGRESRKT